MPLLAHRILRLHTVTVDIGMTRHHIVDLRQPLPRYTLQYPARLIPYFCVRGQC